jgi:CBS domain-containing protein
MRVEEIMTKNPKCCTLDSSLREVAEMMVQSDCGEIPVVESKDNQKPIGVITDRDIVCRAVAKGKNPLDLHARDCMSQPAKTVTADTSVEDCCRLMQDQQIRRIPVVDTKGCLCGIVAQADLARNLPTHHVAGVVKQVSQCSGPRATSAQPA